MEVLHFSPSGSEHVLAREINHPTVRRNDQKVLEDNEGAHATQKALQQIFRPNMGVLS